MALRVALTALLIGYSASASEPILTSEIPPISDRTGGSLLTQGFGPACSVVSGPLSSIPCNPALAYAEDLGKGRKYIFSGRLFVGGEYERFKTVDQILNGPYTEPFVRSLFEENQVIDAQLSGEVSLRSKYFSFGFAPYHLTYFSVVRNQAYPVVALRAVQERIFRVQAAAPVNTWLQAGLQARFVERQLVQNEFTMFEAIAEGRDVFERRDQNVVYLEPGIAVFGEGTWKPKGTLLLSNLGFASRELEETKRAPVIDAGYGVSPPIGFGNLELGIDYRISDMRPNLVDRFGFGADYKLGLIELMLGWGSEYFNFGLMTSFWSAHVAILFASQKFHDADLHERYRNSIMTEFSFDF
jgi:hypothetical protein